MKSYLKFLSRNKLYTAIEAVGLVISIAFVILIGSYVAQQWAVVNENSAHDRIYSLSNTLHLGLSVWDKESLETNIPEIESITRITGKDGELVYQSKTYSANIKFVDQDFFNLFPYYTLVEGSSDDFDKSDNAIISETMARQFENDGNLLGKTIVIDEKQYVICGIMKDIQNSLIQYFDVLVPFDDKIYEGETPFRSIQGVLTLFQRKENTEEEAFKNKVLDLCKQNYSIWGEEWLKGLVVYNYKEMFFNSYSHSNKSIHTGNLTNIRILTAIVILLLLSALINYVNLNMALVGKRAKEMATRRLLGAQKISVMGKLIAESVLFTAVCFGFAYLLAHALVPVMNGLLASSTPENGIQLKLLMKPAYIVAYLSGVLLLGTLSGWLPALYASYYEPIDVVRGTFRYHSKMWLSKIFIVFQNVLSVTLIAIAIVMEVQMWHMIKRPTHLQTKDLFVIDGLYPPREYLPIVEELKSLPCVEEVGIGQGYPGKINYSFGIPYMEDDSKCKTVMAMVLRDSTFSRCWGLKWLRISAIPKPIHYGWESMSWLKAAFPTPPLRF